jgi:predicted metalloendopeptidase
MAKRLLLFSIFLFLFACGTEKMQKKEVKLSSGIDFSTFDKSVRPQDDLYQYVGGTWLKNYEIPADKSSYGSFTKLYDEAQINLRKIIEEAAKMNASAGTEEQKIGDLYSSYMDTLTIEKIGITPLKPYMKNIDQTKSFDELMNVVNELSKIGIRNPIAFWVGQDGKKSDEYITNFYQSGLTLPDKSFYEKDGEKFVTIRQKYLEFIETIFTLSGIEKGDEKAKAILNIETKLAAHHWTRVQNRDRNKTYNKFSIAELDKKMTNINLRTFLNNAGLEKAENVIVFQPSFLEAYNTLIPQIELKDWKCYYMFRLIRGFSSTSGKKFDQANFDFFGKTLSGVPAQSPRWKRAVSTVNGNLGMVVGKVYVKRHFEPEAKERMNTLIDNLVKSFEKRIKGLAWMSENTKVAALEKLKKFGRKIGYPDVWKDYSALEIIPGQITKNLIKANIWDYWDNINKLGKPINRNEWAMTPQRVNAYYSPSKNEIVFPAAILQPPFFNMEADDAVNYGGIGAVIGHELSHGFDDQGSKFDGDGNLRMWWTKDDFNRFNKLGDKLSAQYDSYVPVDSMHVNGKFTLGENIGDLGGLTVAFHAYKESLKGKKSPVLDGFTGEQRFFIGWAQVWMRKYRDAELRNRILTDPHSPSEYRCNGVITNMPEYYETFGLKEGDNLYKKPEDRIIIW